MLSRRSALALLVAVALAGCVGGPLGTGSPDGTPDATPTPGECTENRLSVTDPIRDDVDPSPYPDRPATWNTSTARSYVAAFEQAWARNQALEPSTEQVTVAVSDVTVTDAERGFRVHLTSRTNTWYGGPATGTETATIVHGDGAYIPVAYALTDDRLVRAEGTVGRTPTVGPESGRTVRCFDRS